MSNEERLKKQAVATIGFIVAFVAVLILIYNFYLFSKRDKEKLSNIKYGTKSSVVLFNIDYDGYGQLKDGVLETQINNVEGNRYDCYVYLINEKGELLTDRYPMEPGNSISTMQLNNKYTEGEKVKLVYLVNAKGLHSEVKCDYNIQVIESEDKNEQ